MATGLSPAARTFLEAPERFAVVATVRPDGRAHQAVVWYRMDETFLLVNGRSDRAWVAAARDAGWLSVTVADGYDYVIVSGAVTVIDDPERAGADIAALARQYGDDPADFSGQTRVSFLVRPERVLTHGAPSGA